MRWLILISLLVPTSLSPVLAETAQERSLTEARLQLLNMSCPLCAVTVREALERVPGVARAEVDFKTGRAVVQFDPQTTNPDVLIKAIEEAGYGARIEKASPVQN